MTPAPHPDTAVRPTLVPPPPALAAAPLVQAAHAWRADLRPPPRRPTPWPSAAAMCAIAALLSLYIWTLSAYPVAEAVATTRSAPR